MMKMIIDYNVQLSITIYKNPIIWDSFFMSFLSFENKKS